MRKFSNHFVEATIFLTAAGAGRATSENSYMEFEAKSARDGAWWEFNTFAIDNSSGWDFNVSSSSILFDS